MKIQREWLLLLGSLFVMAALYNHYMGHSVYLVELVFVVIGVLLALASLTLTETKIPRAEGGILVNLLSRVISEKQCAVLLPLSGFLIIFLWSIWKIFAKGESDLKMEDFIVTLFGLSLVLYVSGPSRFTPQKDFVVLYLLFLTIVFAVIWKLYTIFTGDSYYRVTAYSEYYFITCPVVWVLNLLGVHSHAELNLGGIGLSNIIDYEYHGRMLRVGIGTGCSGLYSAGLFFSAFLSFVLVRYRKVDRYIFAALGLGFVVTWASNIFRMVITVFVGSLYGHPALAFVHSYIGILVFVAFAVVFWFVITKWLDRMEANRPPAATRDRAVPADN